MTTTEVAEALNVDNHTILNWAKKCLPNKVIENGKITYWNQKEVTVLLEYAKGANNNQYNLVSSLQGTTTSLTSSLKLQEQIETAKNLPRSEKLTLALSAFQSLLEDLQQENNQLKPKAAFYDAVTQSRDAIDMKGVAKVLNRRIGRNSLFQLLREQAILDRHNQPYQRYVDSGYFRVIESSFDLPTGDTKIYLKTLVLQKGIDFINKLLAKQPLPIANNSKGADNDN